MDENKNSTPYGRSNAPYMNPTYAQGYSTDTLRNAQVLTQGGFKPLSKEERAEAARIAAEAGFSFDGYQVVRREYFSHKFDTMLEFFKGGSQYETLYNKPTCICFSSGMYDDTLSPVHFHFRIR